MRLIKPLIIMMVLICTALVILCVTNVQIGDCFGATDNVSVRIRTQLSTLLRYAAIHSLYILLLLILYVFLSKKFNTLCCSFISKLEALTAPPLHDNQSHPSNNRNNLIYLCLFSLCVVAARNWPNVLNGYFKYDDFEFFSDNRVESLLTLFVTPHGDHLLPLYRLEVAVMNFLFGVEPLYYNLFVSLLVVMVVIFSGLLLQELGNSSFTAVIFSILCICWINWGETVSGYFCLSVYVQIALLSIISLWSYLRWARTSAKFYSLLTVGCIGTAPFLDISGVWVPFGVVFFSMGALFTESPRSAVSSWVKSHRWLLKATACIYCAFAMLNLFVFFFLKHGEFLSMSGTFRHTFFSFFSQLFYTISGGLFLAPLFPIGYHLLPGVLLLILLTALVIAVGWFVLDVVNNSEKKDSWHLISVLIVIFMAILLVVIGRPMAGFNYALAAKYIGVPYIWYCLLICLIWNHYWKRMELVSKRNMATATVLLLFFFIGHQLFFDRVLYAYQAEISGYSANVSEAKIRRKNVKEIQQRLIMPLLGSHMKSLCIPALDGKYIYEEYPKLWKYNLSHYINFLTPYGSMVTCNRNKAMQGWVAKDVATVASLRSNTDVGFLRLLQSDSYVQRMYLSPVELDVDTVFDTTFKVAPIKPGNIENARCLLLQPNGGIKIDSSGAAEVIIDNGTWDPEEKHLLVLTAGYQGATGKDGVKLEVSFNGELKIPYRKNYIVIPSGTQSTLAIDLLQMYSYSLNPQVGNLRISFPTPGTYTISGVSLQ